MMEDLKKTLLWYASFVICVYHTTSTLSQNMQLLSCIRKIEGIPLVFTASLTGIVEGKMCVFFHVRTVQFNSAVNWDVQPSARLPLTASLNRFQSPF